ncbi:hypothetical protein CSAL01_04858 [Colletotrichum salicis]|uniref:Uncharacterized protein n=1 Tax=Colletotrichum salicis TaxID=1209931 RepID=A0A135V655_9PEZI|nr:hypothetical protein CSAL01_04858 [Colletotrichum salicis]
MAAAAALSPLLQNAFSKSTDIGDIVQSFDFSKSHMNVNDTKSEDMLQTKLAPSYGNVNGSVLEKMDDDLKIMIAATMKSLAAQKDKSWNAYEGSHDAGIVKEVQSWFVSLIGDDDVLAATQIDIDVLANIVSHTGAALDSFEAFFAKNEHHERTLIDIAVLRFPDLDRPFFKVK